MILSISEQTRLFFTVIAMGFSIGFLYDIFRILRKTIPHTNALTQIEDMLYWIISCFLMFYFLLNLNNGEVRAYSIIGALIGMVLYFTTLSFLIMKISVAVIEFWKKVFMLIFKIIMVPVGLILKILNIPLHIISKNLKKAKKPAKKVLQNSKRYAKIRRSKIKGELKVIFKKI